MSWEEYGLIWSESMKLTPLGSRLFTLIVGSLAVGVFEEIFWRAYGITMLEDKYGSRMALMLQAVAFGIWYVQPVHAVFATLISVIYGYIFTKRRKLLTLSVAPLANRHNRFLLLTIPIIPIRTTSFLKSLLK